ncbi:uncharacterized protein BO97DRAFT_52652 [Aspergillus homomorphus CBS 101889]|uniref:Uncharacterized protein n=1 Tax=Aspergillus homomorphus (strain CBS 101889) TaxID=1450537 RepID=A0A395HXP8_ASPHC|nr:hypothetical protein BO97DRAFT_52652 [Aspergillus homomorphus CBS 101889]RAL12702.1 hypothetical protein BO97DRAFT_52652 [Aspergillus homomorphus CBS 101889]
MWGCLVIGIRRLAAISMVFGYEEAFWLIFLRVAGAGCLASLFRAGYSSFLRLLVIFWCIGCGTLSLLLSRTCWEYFLRCLESGGEHRLILYYVSAVMISGDAVHELYVDMSIHGVNLCFLNGCSLVLSKVAPICLIINLQSIDPVKLHYLGSSLVCRYSSQACPLNTASITVLYAVCTWTHL